MGRSGARSHSATAPPQLLRRAAASPFHPDSTGTSNLCCHSRTKGSYTRRPRCRSTAPVSGWESSRESSGRRGVDSRRHTDWAPRATGNWRLLARLAVDGLQRPEHQGLRDHGPGYRRASAGQLCAPGSLPGLPYLLLHGRIVHRRHDAARRPHRRTVGVGSVLGKHQRSHRVAAQCLPDAVAVAVGSVLRHRRMPSESMFRRSRRSRNRMSAACAVEWTTGSRPTQPSSPGALASTS